MNYVNRPYKDFTRGVLHIRCVNTAIHGRQVQSTASGSE